MPTMVHTVFLEEKAEGVLKGLLASRDIQVGLLIGQVTKAKDYVLLTVRTPSVHELKDNEEEVSAPSGQIEDWWVVEHGRQVLSLLPGGLGVVGVFCVCPKEALPSLQPRLVKVLSDLCTPEGRVHSKATLLHYCTVSRKSKGQVIDLSQRQGGFRPAEVKVQSNPVQLIRVESNITLSCDLYEHLYGNTQHELLKSAQTSLRDNLESTLSGALLQVSGRFVNEEDTLVVRSKKNEQVPEVIKVDIYTRPLSQPEDDPQLLTGVRRVCINGTLSLMAYLHSKATYREALEALRQDAVRSLTSQLAALTETDQETATPLPCRVSVTTPTVPWTLSEYSLPGEDMKECEGRVCDLLSMVSATAKCPVVMETGHTPQTTPHSLPNITTRSAAASKHGNNQLWTLAAAAVVLIIAMVTWFILYT